MKKIKISGKWRLYYFEQYERNEVSPADLYGRESIPCTVPGNVELELINQGILPEDIYMGQNIRLTEAYEKYEWWYETKITMPDIKGRAYLYFEGVDTLAEYWLDGEIGSTYNFMAEKFIKMQSLFADGKISDVQKIQADVNKIIAALIKVGVTQGEKAVLCEMGLDFGAPRAPFIDCSAEEKRGLIKTVVPLL